MNTTIKITINNDVYLAQINDSPTAQDFLQLLPLTLTLKNYGQTEKIADLPTTLNTQAAPSGSAAQVGDITLYAPWGNLAIFIQNFGYAQGLIQLGHIQQNGAKLANYPNNTTAYFERQ